jgi:hypothetical protein
MDGVGWEGEKIWERKRRREERKRKRRISIWPLKHPVEAAPCAHTVTPYEEHDPSCISTMNWHHIHMHINFCEEIYDIFMREDDVERV